ncbi:MAG: AAA family ATPase [Trueperaceae bacterium]|nr:AAA family ATPase [Trueperaceae bacterium]
MPLLGPLDALPARPRRVLVAGTSGSGKTTLAQQVAKTLDLPYFEIDGLFHGSNWTRRPEFETDVERLTAGEAWVTEWQYGSVRPLLAERADTMIWLDYQRALVMWRVTRRTLQRRFRRQEMWNGNLEPPLHTFFTDKEHIVRWAWDTHTKTRLRVSRLLQDGTHLNVVRLRTPGETDAWRNGPLTAEARQNHAAPR